MSFGSFLKRFFGRSEAVTASFSQPRQNPPASPKIPSSSTTPKREPGVVVFRDEIIGERSRIAGYRFVTRRTDSQQPVSTESVVEALLADNLLSFAQRRLALIPITATDWRNADFSRLKAPRSTLLVTPPVLRSEIPAWLATLEEIKSSGMRIGLTNLAATEHQDALPLADIVLISFSATHLEAFEKLAKTIAAIKPAIEIATDGVGSWVEHRVCRAAGVHYSLGGFAAAPDDDIKAEKLNQSRLVLIEMLNLLRQEASVADLVAVAKRDPGVTVKILDMANSPIAGLSTPVGSLEQALLIVGRETLYRWLSLGIFRAGSDGRDETLLEIALRRARFLELVAAGNRPNQHCDELFLVGMLSVLDSLLCIPMAAALEKIFLPQVVLDVLLHTTGPYNNYLRLALAVEKGRTEHAGRITSELGIPSEKLDESYSAAQSWVEEVLQTN